MKSIIAILIATWATVVASLPAAEQPNAPKKGGDQEGKVKKLLAAFEKGDKTERITAEWELLKLGPDIFPLLPKGENVADIRTTLQELKPRTWTQERAEMKLSEALTHFNKQTGLKLVDRRQSGDDPGVTVDFKNANFWQVVASLAEQTKSRPHFYEADGQLALVDGAAPSVAPSLHGPFRISVKRVASRLDFDGKAHLATLGLEIAWEPRFAPYFIELASLKFRTGQGQKGASATGLATTGRIAVTERNAKEFDVTFPSPPRSVEALQKVSGQFVVLMAAKVIRFEIMKPVMVNAGHSDGGVSVVVSKLDVTKEPWTVELTFTAPAAGPTYESHQDGIARKAWFDHVECRLERGAKENKAVLRPYPLGTMETRVPPTTTKIAFQFTQKHNPGVTMGKFADWKLICQVPGRTVEVTVPFAFAAIDLP